MRILKKFILDIDDRLYNILRSIRYKIMHLFFSCFPIDVNKIFFLSYYGNMYGCNPKYLSEYIVKNRTDWKVVWAFISPKDYNLNSVIKVKYLSIKYFYHLYTSKVLVTNYRMNNSFKKRKEQYYVQTWHSSLRLKMIEKDAIDSLSEGYIKMATRDSLQTDLLISGCKYSTIIFKRAFWFDGTIIETGTPRNDIFFQKDNISHRIKEQLGIANEEKIVLYAPTFRKNQSLRYYDIQFDKLLTSLSTRFGGQWTILLRLHPHLREYSLDNQLMSKSNVIDVSLYNDIQELLCVSDVLISDYSSLVFDFALTHRPCFLYVSDIDDYMANDRKLYFDIESLPFPKCIDNDSLNISIITFDEVKYEKDLSQFNELIGTFETGNACENVVNEIEKRIK